MKRKGSEGVWVCDCPLCRALVKPLLSPGLSSQEPCLEGGESKGDGVGEMGEEIRGEKGKEVEELKELIEALRESIVDLKSAIMDMTSPISKVRRKEPLEEEEEEHEVPPLSASAEIRSTPMIVGKEYRPSTTKREVRGKEKQEESVEKQEKTIAEKEVVKEEEPVKEEKETGLRPRPQMDLKRTVKLLRMLYKLAKKVPSDSIDSYIKLLQALGVTDEKTVETLKIMKEIVESGLKTGLEPEDQIVAIYGIAKMLGVDDPELEEEILQLIIEKIRGGAGNWEPQQQ